MSSYKSYTFGADHESLRGLINPRTQTFLISSRSMSSMYSDNGRNFLACHNILKDFKIQLQERLESSDLKQFLSASIIEWHFIPPYSPHFVGIWEANIKSVKRHLYRTFNGVVLTVEEMNTILCQIESILSSRPLIPISTTDIDEPLTPYHLLTEPRKLCPTNSSPESHFKHTQDLVNSFWKK